MVAKIDLISEASHKHAGEVIALAFDGEHLYSGSEDGVISVRNLDDFFSDFMYFCKVVNFWGGFPSIYALYKVFRFFKKNNKKIIILQSSLSISYFFINRPQLNAY